MIPIANFEQHARKFLESDLRKSLLAFCDDYDFLNIISVEFC